MRKLVAHLIITLDGVVQIDAIAETIIKLRTEEVEADFYARIAEEDAMLLGRVTYQQWAEFWPTSTIQPFADHINRVPKYVVSETLDKAPWGSSESATLLRGQLANKIMALKQQSGKNIGIHGSPKLVESLLHADLLDELRLEIYPIIAGSGARLFNDRGLIRHMHLLDSTITNNGVAILSYQSSPTNKDT